MLNDGLEILIQNRGQPPHLRWGATTVADLADAMFDWGEPSIPNGITTLCENKSDVEPKMMLASSARNPSKQEVDRFLVDNRA